MPKIHGITYSLDGDKQVYRPGDVVSGCWTVELGEAFTVKGIRTALEGAAYTRWSPLNAKKDDKISKENITNQWRTVFGKKLGEDGPNPSVSAGVHKYRFSFKLPEDGLPSSYEGKHGSIRYWLRFQIDRPLLRFNIDRYKVITVVDNIDVNAPEFSKFVGRRTVKKISKALGIGDQGSVTLHAETNRGAYCPGEKIAISLIANNESEKDLGVIKASLIQNTKFIASDEDKHTEHVLRTVTGASLLKKSKTTWNKQLLQVDAVPPSSRERTCHIIKVSYSLKVLIDIPLLQGGDCVVYMPLTIGTIPQGYKPPSSTNAASNSNELDLSSTITYTECNRGFETFKESGSGFPRLDYIPWCVYVPNFKFKPIQNQASPAPAKPSPSTSAAKAKPAGASSATPTQGTVSTTPKPVTGSSAPKPTTSSLTPKPGPTPQLGPTPQAGPLPSKSSLPPPSVVVPPNMLAAGNSVRPEPSAPPIEIAPPSYEEAMAGLSGFITEQPREEVTPDTSSTNNSDDEDKPASKTAFIIVRFLDTFITEFRAKIKDTSEILSKFGGEVIALSSQVIVNKGTWPARTSVAVFMFDTKDGGKQWFDEFVTQCKVSSIEIMDSVLGATREEFQNEKSTFSLNLVTVTANYKSKEWKRYVTLAVKQLTPLRLEIGGVTLAATRLLTPIQGNWPDSKLTLTLSQWESVSQVYEYANRMEADKYKEVNELRKKFFIIETKVFFQTEDLSFLEDSLLDDDSLSQQADDRQEAA